MKDIRYVSINTILSKLRRDYNIDDDFHETDVIEWIGEALAAIDAVTQYENAVAFIEVKNYTACLPNGLHMIQQIARNNCYDKSEDPFCPLKVIEAITAEEPTILPIAIDCNGSPLQDYELAYYRPYFDLNAEAPYVFSNTSSLRACFTPIVPSSHSFFNVNPSSTPNTDKLYCADCQDEYQFIAEGKALRFSFQEGAIALSYVRTYLGEDGYPLIPDNFSYREAVSKYVLFKLMGQRFFRNEQGSDSRYVKAEQDWHWYCKQAKNSLLMPRGEDDHQMLLQQRNTLLPKLNRYYGFFGKLNKMENRKFNDPDRRNNYFSGYNSIL